MKIRLLTERSAILALLAFLRACKHVEVAVAWAGKNKVVDEMLDHRDKLKHVVIGTHMYQTDPTVLRLFEPLKAVKYMPPNGRLFHPKVYLFDFGNSLAAVVGSHNLTEGAFGARNVEASVLIEGDRDDDVLRDIAEFVVTTWKGAKRIDEDFLFPYEKQHQANRAKREALRHFYQLKKPRSGTSKPSPLDLSWSEFVSGVKGDKLHSLGGRLEILDTAAELFTQNRPFLEMTTPQRKAIAGTYRHSEGSLGGLEWGWFGSMTGQGDFKNLINEDPFGLSKALDHITVDGDITEAQFRAFAKDFNAAFTGKAHKGGVATASRLLAIKRPDVFVAVNDANRRGICGAFGVAFSTLDLQNYWERIVVPTKLSSWWSHPRPRSPLNARIWDNRAALLDCIYYDPKAKTSNS